MESDSWKDQFYQTFNDSLIGMAILSPKGVFLEVNDKACEIWEYKREELIGKTWRDITYSEDLDKSSHYVESFKNKSAKYHVILEKRYMSGMGNIKTCKITTSCIRDENQTPRYFITQIFDVSYKKEAVRLIEKTLEKVDEILDK